MKLLAAAANNSGSYSMIIIIVLMFVLMYFMMYRPQKKQQQERQKMLNQIKVGDPVITIGGLHGVIDSMNDADKTVVLDCDGIYLTFSRSAIRGVNKAADASAEAPKSASAAPKPLLQMIIKPLQQHPRAKQLIQKKKQLQPLLQKLQTKLIMKHKLKKNNLMVLFTLLGLYQ